MAGWLDVKDQKTMLVCIATLAQMARSKNGGEKRSSPRRQEESMGKRNKNQDIIDEVTRTLGHKCFHTLMRMGLIHRCRKVVGHKGKCIDDGEHITFIWWGANEAPPGAADKDNAW